MTSNDRRNARRTAPWHSRRRYPRVPLEVDWMLESFEVSHWGRGLEVSLRSARLPTVRALGGPLSLYISLPGRSKMFCARGLATPDEKGVVVKFSEVSDADLALLAECLVSTAGLGAIPQLGKRFQRFTDLHRRFLATST